MSASEQTTAHLEAALVGLTQLRGTWSLSVTCPICGCEHQHGGGTDLGTVRDHLGHRVAHCSGRERSGYVLTDPDDLIGAAMAEGGPSTICRGCGYLLHPLLLADGLDRHPTCDRRRWRG